MKKAFDMVDRAKLVEKLGNAGLHPWEVGILADLYRKSDAVVRTSAGVSETRISCNAGTKQGDPLSPLLFNWYINDLLTELNQVVKGVSVGENVVRVLAYADDIAVLAEEEDDLQRALEVCQRWSEANGMVFSTDKSEVVVFGGKGEPPRVRFRPEHQPLKEVERFKYLGVWMVPSRAWEEHAKWQLGKYKRRVEMARGALTSGLIQLRTKRILYRVLVQSLLDHGTPVWVLTKLQERMFDSAHYVAMAAMLGVCRNASRPLLDWLSKLPPPSWTQLCLKARFGLKMYRCFRDDPQIAVLRQHEGYGKSRRNGSVLAENRRTIIDGGAEELLSAAVGFKGKAWRIWRERSLERVRREEGTECRWFAEAFLARGENMTSKEGEWASLRNENKMRIGAESRVRSKEGEPVKLTDLFDRVDCRGIWEELKGALGLVGEVSKEQRRRVLACVGDLGVRECERIDKAIGAAMREATDAKRRDGRQYRL
jgi:hypothetical protein